MTYKTKIGIAIGVGFAFIIIMAIVMVVFVNNNSGSQISNLNQTGNTTNEATNETEVQGQEVDLNPNKEINLNFSNVYSLGIQNLEDGEHLVKVTNTLETEDIVNVNNVRGYIGFDYQDENVYLAYNHGNGVVLVFYINLNDNSYDLINFLDYNVLNSFYVYNGYVYYVTTNNSIYRYNIEEEIGEEIIIPEDNGTIVNMEIDKENNMLYYMKNTALEGTTSTSVYRYDLENNTDEQIINAAYVGEKIYFYNNYLACCLIDASTYVYNAESNTILELGTFMQLSNSDVDFFNNIAFMENYIAFSDGENIKITDYAGNTVNESLYTAPDGLYITDITAVTSNKLQITTNAETDNISIIDFDSSTISNTTESFYNVLNIK